MKDVVERLVKEVAKRDGSVMVETARHHRAIDKYSYLIAEGVTEHLIDIVGLSFLFGPLEHLVVFDIDSLGKFPSVIALSPSRATDVLADEVEDSFVMGIKAALVP